jgi:hypothetical protein
MPRNRPGKKERAVKRTQDQRALEKLHDRIHTERSSGSLNQRRSKDNKISKPEKSDRTYTSSEVDAIVHAAVTAAVTTTVATTKALLSGDKPKQNPDNSKPARSLAERITGRDPQVTAERATSKNPAQSLADRISFPKKH